MSSKQVEPAEWESKDWFHGHDVRLIGGFYCRLTNEERNEWAQHVQTSREIVTYNVAERRFNNDPSRKNAVEMADAQANLFALGEVWHAALEARKAKRLKEQDDADNSTPAATAP